VLAETAAQRAFANRVFDPFHAQHEEQIAADLVRSFALSEPEVAAYLGWLKVRAEDFEGVG
jgi:hypothetical protein